MLYQMIVAEIIAAIIFNIINVIGLVIKESHDVIVFE